jgi:hypothetical protein
MQVKKVCTGCRYTLKRCRLCIPKMELKKLKNELKYTKKGSKKR